MAKSLVFFADGTWNAPDMDENDDHTPDPTNVYKLFLALEGALSPESIRQSDEQEKVLLESNGATVMVAKYLHGVGDSRSPIRKLLGGAFGAGVISRIVRGFTFISRNYEQGDRIFLVGFSRGAYTARALGGLIASQGLLATKYTADKERAYMLGAQAWYRARKAARKDAPFLARLAEMVAELPAFLSQGTMPDDALVPVKSIEAIAVWDTVGAMGIPAYTGGKLNDSYKFADTKLSPKVQHGFQALALDERRELFTPTLWDPAPHVTQMLFPGSHSDVGGGYPTVNDESGLSDGAWEWMQANLQPLGLAFNDVEAYPCRPSASGSAHKPWAHSPWPLFATCVRVFPAGIPQHPSVQARLQAGPVCAEPGTPKALYVLP